MGKWPTDTHRQGDRKTQGGNRRQHRKTSQRKLITFCVPECFSFISIILQPLRFNFNLNSDKNKGLTWATNIQENNLSVRPTYGWVTLYTHIWSPFFASILHIDYMS